MGLLESHTADQCKTAEDVRRMARTVLARRQQMRHPPPGPAALLIALQEPTPQINLPIDHPLYAIIKQAVANVTNKRSEPTAFEIQEVVCFVYKLTRKDLLSERRYLYLIEPRHLSFLLCSMLTSLSLPTIGNAHRGKDHTTVLHAIRKYDWLRVCLEAEGLSGKPLIDLVERAKELIGKTPKDQRYGAYTHNQA